MEKIDFILARRYAKAFLTPDLDENNRRFDGLADLRKKLSSVDKYFLNPAISRSVKKELLGKILSEYGKTSAFRLLEFLIVSGRFNILDAIIKSYLQLLRDLKGVQTAEITTAYEPDKNTLADFKIFIEKLTGKKAEIKFRKDSLIIGGFQIKVGDNFIDASLSGELNRLKKTLSY